MELKANGWVQDMRGASGGVVFKRQNGKLIVAQRPRASGKPPSAAQTAVRDRFRSGARYAKAVLQDITASEPYRLVAAARQTSPSALALADYYVAPTIREIDVSRYSGAAGSSLTVYATDDFGVTEVEVAVLNAAGAVLEEGLAIAGLAEDWSYTALTAAPANQTLTLRAKARDRAGNTTVFSRTWPQ